MKSFRRLFRYQRAGYLFVLPGFLYMLVFVGWPMLYNVILSLQDVTQKNLINGERQFVALANYADLFADSVFRRSIGNTLFRGRKAVLLAFLVTQMLPVLVLLTPMFLMFRNMHLYNTWGAAILADATIGIPFSVLILKNYFSSIPGEMEEAAYIDGCNRFTSFVRVLIPIAKPGIVVCAIFSFLYAWGDLAYSMTFILDQVNRPITAGIYNFMGQYGTKWSYLTAYAIVTIIPVAIIFIFMQKYIISGMTSGAVKG